MSFDDPVANSAWKHAASIECTANLAEQIKAGGSHVMESIQQDGVCKVAVRQHHRVSLKERADAVQAQLPPLQQRAMDVVQEKGASSMLTTIPVAEHGFCFEVKADFRDHICLRYGWPLDRLPASCPCGERFTIDHAQICKLAGFIHMCHDEVTDFLALCMKELHGDAEVEPTLLPLSGESFRHRTANTEPDARADIRVRGFWTQSRNAFFDTRVFYPHASSYRFRPSLRYTASWRRIKSASMEIE